MDAGPTDEGYEITGPALAVGTEAEYAITIARLPADRTEFVLKTPVGYSDGSEDARIEEPTVRQPRAGEPCPGDHGRPGGRADVLERVPLRSAERRTDQLGSGRRPLRRCRSPTSRAPRPGVVLAIVVVVGGAVVGGLAPWRRSRSRG
jgi:hypothetical protein